jgi:hypothetical protein
MVNGDQAMRYRYDWERFTDWCTAHGHTPLPADPTVIGAYLTAAPAAPATQRGRLSAINWAHRAAGLPAPGRAPALRETLNAARAARTARLQGRVDNILPSLPVWGWPGGLFGRRDAAILHLARSGLPFAQIASLARQEVSVTSERVTVGSGPLATLYATEDPAHCPVGAFRRWSAVLDIVPRPTAIYLLEYHLERQSLPEIDIDQQAAAPGPLLFALDRDGNPALKPTPLTPGSIGIITASHLLGRASTHRPRKRRHADESSSEATPLFDDYAPLLGEYFERGTAARKRGLDSLADIDALLDAAEAQADRVLRTWG